MPRFALAQINVTVGDLDGNAARILAAAESLAQYAPDLVVFPEMTLSGYPPEDLLHKPGFIRRAAEVLTELVPKLPVPCVLGCPLAGAEGVIHNAAVWVENGGIVATYHKQALPNYAVFDEARYFEAGGATLVRTVAGVQVGIVICEDAWVEGGPVVAAAEAGATVVCCLSASPFHKDKRKAREETFRQVIQPTGVHFLYSNLVGGQDELVFDGSSLVMDGEGAS